MNKKREYKIFFCIIILLLLIFNISAESSSKKKEKGFFSEILGKITGWVSATANMSIQILPKEAVSSGVVNATIYGIYEPLCCAGGTGNWCLDNSQYNETTGIGDIYCEGSQAGNNIVVNVQHVMKFEFSNLTVNENDTLECYLEQSDGSLLYVSKTNLSLVNQDYTLEYAVSNDTEITRDTGTSSIHDLPWGILNCSIRNETDIINSTTFNEVIFMHRNLQWEVFDYQKAVFAESVPYKFFNNTLALNKPFIETDYKSYARYLSFKHYAGSQTEEFCFDELDNDGDTTIDYLDNDCRTFAHRYNTEMNYSMPYFTGIVFGLIKGITGYATFNEEDNIITESLGGTNYWYTVNTDFDGSFKVRIYETSPGSNGYGYTIKGVPNVSSVDLIGILPSGYSSSYACGAAAGQPEGVCNINFDCAACSDTLVDFVYIVNSSNSDYSNSDTFEFETVHGTTIETENFDAYFDADDGLNNTLESESFIYNDNLCDDSVNNDLDISTDYTYITGLATTNRLTWSRDCADFDCQGINGPSYTAEQGYTFNQSICEYKTETICDDSYDNDFNDNYSIDAYGMQGIYYTDCHDVDCFQNNVECPVNETICNDGLNNDWDYVDTDSESTSGHKIGNTDNYAVNGSNWNGLKYVHNLRTASLIDCEDPDCDGSAGIGGTCEWAHEKNCSDGFNNDALQQSDCNFNAETYGTQDNTAPAYSHAEYDCANYCRTNIDSAENSAQCDDGIDNDWDYYDNSSIFSGSVLGGIDCGWNGSGKSYTPDTDCHLEIMGNGYRCELGNELTCNDSFDNDYDDGHTTNNANWDESDYNSYFSQFGMAYSSNADCDDYDCQGQGDCPTNESIYAAWCFDDTDNDLDGDVDCSDSDCVGVQNPDNVTEICLEYELNKSRLNDSDANTSSYHFCGNNLDDENKDDDNPASPFFSYNSIGFIYTGERTAKMDCNDEDCRQKFGQCAPCSDNELVEWDSCFDGLDNDHDGSSDDSDSDCDNQIMDYRGYNGTNGPSTEISCMNYFDDDNDGDTDCEDSDCVGQQFSPDGRLCGALQGTETSCNDDFDNDGNGNIDCYDSNCYSSCAIEDVSGSGITHSPQNSSFSLTGDVTISGTATEIIRKGNDLYVSYSYSGTAGGVTIVLGSYATGEIINTNAFDVNNAEFISNPDSFSMDKTYANNGYLTFTRGSTSSFSFSIKIPGKGVLMEQETIKSTAEIGTNTALGTFTTQVVNNESPSISEIRIEPSNGKLTVDDELQIIAGNFTGVSGGQSNSGGEGRCRIQVSGPNEFSVDEYSNNCKSSGGSSYEIDTSGTYYVTITPYDNTGNQGNTLTDNITLSVAPRISLGLSRSDSKRVHFDSSDSRLDSLGDTYNDISGTMLARFKTDVNNMYPDTDESCKAIVKNENGNIVFTKDVSASVSGNILTCDVDLSIADLTNDGLYRVTVNATDNQGYELETSEVVIFRCNSLSSSGDTWDCSLTDFDVDGYTEGITLPFNYSSDGLTFYTLACDSCPEDTNLGKDFDSDGYDNACDAICGDGYTEGDEECDDGNTIDGDGCDSNCDLEEEERVAPGAAAGEEEAVALAPPAYFEIEPDPFIIDIRQGQTKTVQLSISNKLSVDMNIEINYSLFEDLILIRDTEFILGPLESKVIEVEVFADFDKEPDSYIGNIIITGNEVEEKLETVINVKSGEALFDIITRMITKVVKPGEKAEAEIELTNIGDKGPLNASLYYAILDFENNTLASAQEHIIVENQLTLQRSLMLPKEANETLYVFYASVTYDDLVAASSDVFTTSEAGNWVLFIIIMALIILIIIIIIILYRRNIITFGNSSAQESTSP